ncbi:hypothetical protein ZWY2020_035939 [Hordeum vulgare]|nr:hypothetical protein ZWY2020_035939 [Hordeum vulgare]
MPPDYRSLWLHHRRHRRTPVFGRPPPAPPVSGRIHAVTPPPHPCNLTVDLLREQLAQIQSGVPSLDGCLLTSTAWAGLAQLPRLMTESPAGDP